MKKINVILLSGSIGAGKTTIASLLDSQETIEYSLSTPLKEELWFRHRIEWDCLDRSEKESCRSLMAQIDRDFRSRQTNPVFEYLDNVLMKAYQEGKALVIDDLRTEEELKELIRITNKYKDEDEECFNLIFIYLNPMTVVDSSREYSQTNHYNQFETQLSNITYWHDTMLKLNNK